jgi:molybdopterin molybdotransferase
VRWLGSANCLLDIPADVTELPAGSLVQIWDLR